MAPTTSANEAGHRRSFIKHYERIYYDTAALDKIHQEAKLKEDGSVVLLEFQAYQRIFKLRLRRDMSVFAKGFQITRKGALGPMDVSFIYSGELQGEPGSFCHGSIINGLFEGFIQTWNGTYYIQSAGTLLANQTFPGHLFIHHESDLDYRFWGDPKSVSLAKQTHQHLQDFQRKLIMKNNFRRQKRSLDYSKTSCLLHIQVDYLFYQRFGSTEVVIAQIASYIKAVNAIYKGVEFDGIRNVDFRVKMINIIEEEDRSGSMQSPFISAEMLLMLHSKSNWNSYCLAFLLTDRDYSGVLGIAFNGQAGNSGGICSKHQNFQGKDVSLNTGLITLQKYGQVLPPRMIHITLSHEFGHSLGAYHDESKECARFDFDTTHGKYLMFGYATDGEEFNNDKFSPCSIAYIAKILRMKKDLCFVETDLPICGNRIVDPGEDCDVGNDVTDACCYSASEPDGKRCRLKPGALCSPSQGLCCSHECVHKPHGDLCQEETDCASESVCSGSTAKCPVPLPKANFTICGRQSQVCLNGLCVGSLCIQHGLEQCDCISSSLAERCQLCCQLPGQAKTCASTTSPEWHNFFNGSKIRLMPGSPCKSRTGYCDKFHICQFVDEDGPVARMKNFILNFIEMEDIATWMKTRWWAVLLIVLTLAAMMAGTIFLFGRTVDTETDDRITRGSDKVSVGQPSAKKNTFYYWEHEIYIEAMHQEYETII
ncbi:disintegrin and metalloproteinase domain-containing protein 10-like [Tiliqua scincoides]|uniref:disintegrin and metalloproteinase domain-containing protein 10-like n=1 Tax=Tiliqua scincoides TaxID=71010 RepID=UPI003463836D